MGIRFSCENGHAIHVKAFLAGKRGICPKCGVKVLIPLEGTRPVSESSPPTAESPPPHEKVSIAPPPAPGEGGAAPAGQPTRWYVRAADGQQYGPATTSVFQEWIASGRVGADCLVWREDWDAWRSAVEVLAEQPPAPQRESAPTEPPRIEVPRADDPVRSRGKRKSRKLVIALIVLCLTLLFPLIYVVTVMS